MALLEPTQKNFVTFSTPVLYLLAITSLYICISETNTINLFGNSVPSNFIQDTPLIVNNHKTFHEDVRTKREIFLDDFKRENISMTETDVFLNSTDGDEEKNSTVKRAFDAETVADPDINSVGYFNLYNFSDYEGEEECQSLDCMPYEDYVELVRKDVMTLSVIEWIFVGAHTVVFIVGLVGNALVCVAVYRNHSMRTVTNYFIVNLALADFMVILFCLPPTVIWDTMHTWFFGVVLCKVVLYLQNVSVTVSVLTLTFISIDRWYAICYPLKFKSTTSRAKTCIIIIWLLALSTDIPELIVLTTVKPPRPNITEVYYTQCDAQWSQETDTVWNISRTIILYFLPLAFMSFAYCQIVRVLWRTDNALHIPNDHLRCPQHRNHDNGNTRGLQCSSGNATRRSTFVMNTNTTTEGQLRSRRKAAKMLVAVVVMFAVCYFPVHLLNIIRGFRIEIEHTEFIAALILFTHWLIYANSAVNPLIYNFMSGKFRKEFHTTFGCWCCRRKKFHRRRQTTMTRSSTYICRYTTTVGGSTNARTEVIPLSQIPPNFNNHHHNSSTHSFRTQLID